MLSLSAGSQFIDRLSAGFECLFPCDFIVEFCENQGSDRILFGIVQRTGAAEGLIEHLRHVNRVAD